ncbi:RusA family crossover junction endodeoxyribonuclease [Microvirgula aerodenitrificans]|uniref:RusA family crossover junction endodeoxyribonuclease n=1 Tax=Microvirgula aerodenitrificans TaxID=57480 RepID=UPI0028ECEA31|nr:RusA family crossover junction endodeoxyribonuclease [Microvirgula aerodenitrificans]
MIELTMPYPPSANTYWRSPNKGALAGRHLLSEKGRRYRAEVQTLCLVERVRRMTGRVTVEMLVCPPDRRRRDLDNVLKATLDSLTHGGAWDDDSQIDRLVVSRGDVVPGGRLLVRIKQYERGQA